ncbi:phosphodiester glycosidase family protein [Halocella sp. SP3-1]|uniref:phosphodiester glycosidase family protein n=1 Tax=Halocella sp. SP3-1 TaxID=2382161 RepID=UPI000F75F184|nr:phosphodiester glycosidase family protein [Halocella sp. SP3-1]AZO94072.1 hypothetical protein D7D81_05395 [Halocella sp. SP3-1]
MENFIRDGKKVSISLKEGKEYIWLLPDKNMVLVEPGSNNTVTLKGSQTYLMRPGKIDNNIYQVQVFASFDKLKAETVFNDLVMAGFQDVFLLNEGDWFKVRVGRLSARSAAEVLVPELENKGYSTWVLREEKPVEMINIYDVEGDNIFSARSIELIEGVKYQGKNYPGVLGYALYNNKINIYNKVELNQLITVLVSNEVKDLYHDLYLFNKSRLEALLKSQAVITRTNLLSKIINKKGDFIYLPSYQGIEDDRMISKISKAVQLTDGIVLERNNKLIEVSFNTRELLKEAGSGKNYQTILSDLNNYQLIDFKIIDLTPAVIERVRIDAKVKRGLNYKEIYQLTWWGPRVISILDLDLTKTAYIIEPVLAGGVVQATADLVEIVKSRNALAGVNGGYFSYTGRPLGLLIKDGVTVSEPVKDRTAVIFTNDDILLAKSGWQAVLQKAAGNSCLVNGVNRYVGEDELIVYNKYYGEKAPELGAGMIELLVIDNLIKAVNTHQEGSRTEIPDQGMVFQAHGSAVTKLEEFQLGDRVEYREDFSPELQDLAIVSALGGGPRLLKEGKVFITAHEEEFQNDIAYGRAPRTALGLSNDKHLLVFTVDGRQPSLSIGITLEELAEFMQRHGVEEGMNLDGGSSARMVVRGFTMNNPSAKRLISNAIIFRYNR